ncbi:MAG: signal recognition particle-docking protein FtsY [Fidelibacterota bacterium]
MIEKDTGYNRGLRKTRLQIFNRLKRVFIPNELWVDDLIEVIEKSLIEADMGVETAVELIESLKVKIKKDKINSLHQIFGILEEQILAILDTFESVPFLHLVEEKKPFIIMVIGINGTGKTTFIGKMAYALKRRGKRVLVAAADTFRAAAVDQLEIWAKRAGVDIVKNPSATDPASVAFDAVNSALARGFDVVLIDTAGRLHTKINLMEELKKIKRILSRKLEGSPHEVLLVLDATIGQNSISQAKRFSEEIGVTGLILTKIDGTAKGGAVIPIIRKLKIPVKFLGIGEKIEDMEEFDPVIFTKSLFDELS